MKSTTSGQAKSGELLLRQMSARRRRDNVVMAVLAVLAVLGGGHAIISFFTPEPEPPGDDAAISLVRNSQLAGAFAEDFVVTYLSSSTGDEERLARFMGDPQGISLPKQALDADDPIVVYVSRREHTDALDVWSVFVSVQLEAADAKDTAAQAPRQYFQVPVSVSGNQLRALAPPAEIEPPRLGSGLAQRYNTQCGEQTPFATVATGFLTAFLTGTPDVSRYISSAAVINALSPSPYRQLSDVRVRAEDAECGTSGNSARILATVVPEGAHGELPTLAYPLTLDRNGGQWQVRQIDDIPALVTPLKPGNVSKGQPPQGSSSTTTPTTTPGSGTTQVEIPAAGQSTTSSASSAAQR